MFQTYEKTYGFEIAPFRNSCDPRFFFAADSLAKPMRQLEQALRTPFGISVVGGEAGIGKTMALRAALQKLEPHIPIIYLQHQFNDGNALFKAICHELHLEIRDGFSKTELVLYLQDYLDNLSSQNTYAILILDNAHALKWQLFEELQQLVAYEPTYGKSLHLCLLGRAALQRLLQMPELQSFSQQIHTHIAIPALSHTETAGYIRHRLKVAGYRDPTELFDDSAVDRIYVLSEGAPRAINILCENALILGGTRNIRRFNAALVDEVVNRSEGTAKSAQESPAFASAVAAENRSGMFIDQQTEPIGGPLPGQQAGTGTQQRDPTFGFPEPRSSGQQRPTEMDSFLSREENGHFRGQDVPAFPEQAEISFSRTGNQQRAVPSAPAQPQLQPRHTPQTRRSPKIDLSPKVLEAIAERIQYRMERVLREKYILIKKPEPAAYLPIFLIFMLTYILAILLAALILRS